MTGVAGGRFSQAQAYGLAAERWITDQLIQRGYGVKMVSLWTAKYDILIENVLRGEIKIRHSYNRKIRPGYYAPTWHFNLSGGVKNQDRVLFLICEDENGLWWPYIVPSWYLFGRQTCSITSHPVRYSGQLAASLRNWSAVETVLARRQKAVGQLVLPLFVEA